MQQRKSLRPVIVIFTFFIPKNPQITNFSNTGTFLTKITLMRYFGLKCSEYAAKKFVSKEHPFYMDSAPKIAPVPKFWCFVHKFNPLT